MKIACSLFLTLLLSMAAYADEFIIKLNPKADTTLQKRNFYFSAVEDNRDVNEGQRQVGHFGKNDKTTAVLETDLQPFFLNYLSQVYPKREGDRSFILRVNVFECSSTGGMLSEAKVKLDFDIVDAATDEVLQNVVLERTRQPLMGGKTFGVLIQEMLAYGAEMIK